MAKCSSPGDDRPLLLLVEDEDGPRRSLQLLLTGQGYRVRAYSAAAAVISDDCSLEAPLLVTDYRLHDSDGLRLLAALRQRGWPGRAILVTGYPSKQLDDAARAAGFGAVLEKPLRHQQLWTALKAGD